MKWVKVGLVNALVLFVFLLAAEFGLRAVWSVRSCLNGACDFRRLTGLEVRDIDALKSVAIGISVFDDRLGYLPRKGFDEVISGKGWRGSRVTMTAEGFRSNGAGPDARPPDILVAGDSFTFGDQVSNHETWPACLEKKLARRVDNGGVFGFGTAQALRRATLVLEGREYTTLVLSVLVGADFVRDRMSYRSGHPKPALVKDSEGRISWSAVSDPNERGTKYNRIPRKRILGAFYENSLLVALLIEGLAPDTDFWGESLTRMHPNAAGLDEIIEWTLTEFSKVEVKEKVLLLQYASLADGDALQERPKILAIAARLGLRVVDTFDRLGQFKRDQLWYPHHTPLGNEVVCNELAEKGFGPGR